LPSFIISFFIFSINCFKSPIVIGTDLSTFAIVSGVSLLTLAYVYYAYDSPASIFPIFDATEPSNDDPTYPNTYFPTPKTLGNIAFPIFARAPNICFFLNLIME
jgi:hypothetical protein